MVRCLVVEHGTAAIAVIRTLGRAGFDCDLLARWSATPPPRSRFCSRILPVESWDDTPAVVQSCVDVIRDGGYGCVFPCGDRPARLLSRHRAAFAPVLALDRFLPSPEAFETLLSKAGATRKAAEVGIPVPRTLYDPSDDDLERLARDCPHGLVIKRDDSFASRWVRPVSGFEEARRACTELRRVAPPVPILAQERIVGPGYLFHALYWEGRPHRICLHRKDHEYPVRGGVSARGVTEHAPEPIELGIRLLDSLRWNGLVKLDYVHSQHDGRWYLIEADPRVSSSIDVTRAAGADQVVALARLVSGEVVPPDLSYRAGVVYRWLFPREILYTAERRAWAGFLGDFLRPGATSDLDLLDPAPTLARLKYSLRALRAHSQGAEP